MGGAKAPGAETGPAPDGAGVAVVTRASGPLGAAAIAGIEEAGAGRYRLALFDDAPADDVARATDYEEFAEGLSCIAVPIDGGMSPFAFVVSAPTHRLQANFDAYRRAVTFVASTLSNDEAVPS